MEISCGALPIEQSMVPVDVNFSEDVEGGFHHTVAQVMVPNVDSRSALYHSAKVEALAHLKRAVAALEAELSK